MAKYSDIKGFTVQTLESDPIASQIAGGAWASGGAMPATRFEAFGAGTQTAALVSGGASTPPASANTVNTTIEYDGSSWTSGNNINTTRYDGGDFGTQTAAIDAGGDTPPSGAATDAVESYDGTNWTEIAEINTARNGQAGMGTTTAGLIAGGSIPASPYYGAVAESWNGSAWTEVNDLNDARNGPQGMGSSTAALVCGGYNGTAYTGNTEVWNGSAWTEVNNLNNGREGLGTSGTSTLGLAFGGYFDPSPRTLTEAWDGTNWTEVADLSQARSQGTGSPAGTQALGLYSGGTTPPGQSVVEEWSAPAIFTKQTEGQLFFNSTTNTFKETLLDAPGGTWAAGGDLNSGRNTGMGAGASLNAGLCFGGPPIPPSPASRALTEQYNGTSWTEVNDLNSGKKLASSASSAPYSDTLNFAGDTSPSPVYSLTNESWDGTSWTEQADLNVAGNAAAGVGSSSTAALRAAGQSTATPPGGPHYTGTEVWNGSSWTEVNEVNTSRRYLPGMGTTSAGLITGGDTDNPSFPGGRYTGRTESWNGTSWTEVNDLNSGRFCSGAGSQTLSIAFGGGPPQGVLTEAWDGTSWTEVSDMTYPSQNSAPGGTAVSALRMGGETASAPNNNKTEEWSGGLANKSITVS